MSSIRDMERCLRQEPSAHAHSNLKDDHGDRATDARFQLPLFAGALFIALLCPCIAAAALGEPESSVQADGALLRGSIKVSDHANYRLHEIKLPSGTLVREFAGPDGKIFAVAWRGPAAPNLRQTFGATSIPLRRRPARPGTAATAGWSFGRKTSWCNRAGTCAHSPGWLTCRRRCRPAWTPETCIDGLARLDAVDPCGRRRFDSRLLSFLRRRKGSGPH